MKLFFWLWTVIGVLPLLLFAALHVYSTWQIQRELSVEVATRELAENEFVSSTSTVQFDGMRDPMVTSTSIWPAVVCLLGISIAFVGLAYLIPKQPIRLRTAVYERLPGIVKRVVASTKPYASLIISARDGNYSILLSKREGRVEISLSGNHTEMAQLSAIREYFSGLGLTPSQDDTTHDETFDITTTHLAYDLSSVSIGPAEVCTHIFRDIYAIGSDELLELDLND